MNQREFIQQFVVARARAGKSIMPEAEVNLAFSVWRQIETRLEEMRPKDLPPLGPPGGGF